MLFLEFCCFLQFENHSIKIVMKELQAHKRHHHSLFRFIKKLSSLIYSVFQKNYLARQPRTGVQNCPRALPISKYKQALNKVPFSRGGRFFVFDSVFKTDENPIFSGGWGVHLITHTQSCPNTWVLLHGVSEFTIQ